MSSAEIQPRSQTRADGDSHGSSLKALQEVQQHDSQSRTVLADAGNRNTLRQQDAPSSGEKPTAGDVAIRKFQQNPAVNDVPSLASIAGLNPQQQQDFARVQAKNPDYYTLDNYMRATNLPTDKLPGMRTQQDQLYKQQEESQLKLKIEMAIPPGFKPTAEDMQKAKSYMHGLETNARSQESGKFVDAFERQLKADPRQAKIPSTTELLGLDEGQRKGIKQAQLNGDTRREGDIAVSRGWATGDQLKDAQTKARALGIEKDSAVDKIGKPGQPELYKNASEVQKLADSRLPGDESRLFAQNMDGFMRRGDISAAAKTAVLNDVKGLLSAKGSYSQDGPGGLRNNALAAEGIMHHANDPDSIGQGATGFCGPSSIEYNLFNSHPELASSMIKSTMLDGKWTGRDGQTVTVAKDSLVPNIAERAAVFPATGSHRSYAAQALGSLIYNDIGQHMQPKLTLFENNVNPNRKTVNDLSWRKADGTSFSMLPSNPPKDDPNVKAGILDATGGPTGWQMSQELQRLTGEKSGVLQSAAFKYDGTNTDKGYYKPSMPSGPDQGLRYISPDKAAGMEQLRSALENSMKNGNGMLAQVQERYVHDLGAQARSLDKGTLSPQDTETIRPPKTGEAPDHFIGVSKLFSNNGMDYVTIHNSADGRSISIPLETLHKALSS